MRDEDALSQLVIRAIPARRSNPIVQLLVSLIGWVQLDPTPSKLHGKPNMVVIENGHHRRRTLMACESWAEAVE